MPDASPSPPSADPAGDDTVAAGDLGAWLVEVRGAIAGERASDVPCGSCTACCTSSQFVHIGPDEIDTLAHVPRRLTFPAPGLPGGHVLLGYALSLQHGEATLRRNVNRLRDAGLIVFRHHRGGGRWGLTRRALAAAKGAT